MTDKKDKIFYGICLGMEEVDERLGILDELLEDYSKEEAEDIYDGAYENCSLIFDHDYYFNENSLFYFGKFLDFDDNIEDQKKKIFNEISGSLNLLEEELGELSIDGE